MVMRQMRPIERLHAASVKARDSGGGIRDSVAAGLREMAAMLESGDIDSKRFLELMGWSGDTPPTWARYLD